jgi:hypothetical protein
MSTVIEMTIPCEFKQHWSRTKVVVSIGLITNIYLCIQPRQVHTSVLCSEVHPKRG